MRGINKVTLIGNLGCNPEIRYTASNNAVAVLAVATGSVWKDKIIGEKHSHTEWHRVIAYKQLAGIAKDYFHKGTPIYVEGRLKTRKWTDTNGINHYITEIIASALQSLGGAKQDKDLKDKMEEEDCNLIMETPISTEDIEDESN